MHIDSVGNNSDLPIWGQNKFLAATEADGRPVFLGSSDFKLSNDRNVCRDPANSAGYYEVRLGNFQELAINVGAVHRLGKVLERA